MATLIGILILAIVVGGLLWILLKIVEGIKRILNR
jgi:heme/copper-type cytochrome/quinol oxidase subunit 4